MTRWVRFVRGMVGTGLTFAVGGGVIGVALGVATALAGKIPLLDAIVVGGRFAVAAFVLGVGFSGIVALTSRSRRLAELSIPRFAALGAGAGLLYFGLIAINGIGAWSTADTIANFVILTGLGGGTAASTLYLAHRGRAELDSGDDRVLLSDDR